MPLKLIAVGVVPFVSADETDLARGAIERVPT